MGEVHLTVIVAARNERPNLRPLVEELDQVLDGLARPSEIIIVDDGSTDGGAEELNRLLAERPRLRVLSMDRCRGQSAAYRAGSLAARGKLVAMMDADGQNDPADLPVLLERLDETGADLVQGDRTARRADHRVRKWSSSVGWWFRRWALGDLTRDTGCSLRVMTRSLAVRLPLEFRGMHRFIPVTARDLGGTVVVMPVNHRSRWAGATKYGVLNRAIPGFVDLLAVRWMQRRRQPVTALERTAPHAEAPLVETKRPATELQPRQTSAGRDVQVTP